MCIDKGTYDAISLNPDNSKRCRELYKTALCQLLKRNGLIALSSCNWTLDELKEFFRSGRNVSSLKTSLKRFHVERNFSKKSAACFSAISTTCLHVTAKPEAQVPGSLLQACYFAVIKPISGCVCIACFGFMITTLLQVVITRLDAGSLFKTLDVSCFKTT